MKRVICLGEALVDFIPLDSDHTTYQKSPGGAPANVAVGVTRLGANASFLGAVGKDVLGDFLQQTLNAYGVDTAHMHQVKQARTGLTFVSLDTSGERQFSFYIDPSADRYLHPKDVAEQLFATHQLLHFGSISLIGEPTRSATLKAIHLAKKHGLLITYDPNVRLRLWRSAPCARETILSVIHEAHIVKISTEELAFLTETADLHEGIEALRPYNIPLLFVTDGASGSYYCAQGIVAHVPTINVRAVDTTGAGDAFMAGVLSCVSQEEKVFRQYSREQLRDITFFANVCGALATTAKGAMQSLPTRRDVEHIFEERPL